MKTTEEGIKNGVQQMDDKVTVSQNAKGIWSCKDITIYGKTEFDMIKKLDKTMTDVEIILEAHNSDEQPEEKEKADEN